MRIKSARKFIKHCKSWLIGQIPMTRQQGWKSERTKKGFFCSNKESEFYLSMVCQGDTCPDYQR